MCLNTVGQMKDISYLHFQIELMQCDQDLVNDFLPSLIPQVHHVTTQRPHAVEHQTLSRILGHKKQREFVFFTKKTLENYSEVQRTGRCVCYLVDAEVLEGWRGEHGWGAGAGARRGWVGWREAG